MPEFAALIFAIYKLGVILVPLNPAFNAPETEAALSKVGASILITAAVSDTPYKASRGRCNQPLLAELLGPLPLTSSGRLQLAHLPSLKHIFLLDNRSSHPEAVFDLEACPALSPFQALLGGSESPVKPQESLDPSDVINIQFTSGTTSAPKAAMLAHSSILNNSFLVAHRLGLQSSDRLVVPPPLFHCFGSVLGLLATTVVGASILFPSPAFDPVASLRMCADHKATGLYGVTTMFSSILEALDSGVLQDPPSDLVKGIVAGSCVPEALMEHLSRRLGLDQLAICYGMTETGPVSCMTRHTDPALKRSSTVGTPMAHTSVKIVSPEDHSRILPFNTRGELAAGGYLVMEGYYDDAENTAKVKVDQVDPSRRRGDAAVSWMYSGDEAEMDPDGYVTITGRIKDLIIRGGENIQPLAIENCLCRHPEISEASVVGLPDERLGEVVVAVILLRTSERPTSGRALSPADVRDWVRARLSTHLVPQHVLFFDQLPKTASGKIRKSEVRHMAAKALSRKKGTVKKINKMK